MPTTKVCSMQRGKPLSMGTKYICYPTHTISVLQISFSSGGGNYAMYDLKTVYGKNSVKSQLSDSFGQTNRVLLNMATDYNSRLLASDIKIYFETNQDAVEVLIFKGNKVLTIKRGMATNPDFNRIFRRLYEK